jgi:uncharacterized membrane protein
MEALFPLLKWLHILGAAAAVAIVVWGDLLFQRVALTGDTGAVAAVGAAIRRRVWIEALIVEITVVLGVAAALTGSFDLLAPWLLIAYGLVVAITVLAIRVGAVEFTSIIEAADRDDREAMRATARSRRRVGYLVSQLVLFAAIIGVMVVKPLS